MTTRPLTSAERYFLRQRAEPRASDPPLPDTGEERSLPDTPRWSGGWADDPHVMHDDRCATRRGHPCNCALAAFDHLRSPEEDQS